MNTKTMQISYDTIQDVIASHLYAFSVIDDDIDIIDIDLGLEVNDEGLVTVDVTTNKKVRD